MRRDRWTMRVVKLAVLFGAVGLIGEGLFELRLLVAPLTAPPSIPGQSKIIEHFVVQHVAFPIIAMLLAFAPLRLVRLFGSKLAASLLAVLAGLVTMPELVVSRTDLFRPYPFELHAGLLRAVQMIDLGAVSFNLLQAQHLIFAHLVLMGSIVVVALSGGKALRYFAGPRTGEADLQRIMPPLRAATSC